MFINWSTDETLGKMGTESIRGDRFEVSGPGVYRTTLIVAVAATILYLIGASLAISQPTGSTLFWVGSAEGLLGVSLVITTAVIHHIKSLEHQSRMLHRCQTVEEYQTLLAEDQRVHYTFKVADFINKHEAINKDLGADLGEQTGKDSARIAIYCIEGKTIPSEEVAARFGDKARYANQSALADLSSLLMSRYFCKGNGVDINVAQLNLPPDSTEPKPLSRYNLLSDGNVMELEQLYRIVDADTDTSLKYLRGKVRIDFRTGDAVFTWSSPQDERPSF